MGGTVKEMYTAAKSSKPLSRGSVRVEAGKGVFGKWGNLLPRHYTLAPGPDPGESPP